MIATYYFSSYKRIIIILTLLENAIKYIHNSGNKKYKSSIKTICKLYDNVCDMITYVIFMLSYTLWE